MKIFRILLFLFILIVLTSLVSAQIKDSDGDGVKDEFDMCQNTPNDAGLPLIEKGTKYLGCSCSQIEELQTADLDCLKIFCEVGRPLDISERFFSVNEINCGADYCIGNTLYNFPDVTYPKCVSGKLEKNCEPIVTENSVLCVYGQVGQKSDEKPVEKETVEVVEEPVVMETEENNYVQEAYDLVLENVELKDILQKTSREKFSENMVYLLNNVQVEKIKGVEEKEIQGTSVYIPYMNITIKPNELRTLENVLVFEKITKKEIGMKDILFDKEPLMISNKIIVWLIKDVPKEGVTISYKSKNPIELESQTIIVGEVKKIPIWKDWWPLILVPIIGYLSYLYIVRTNK